MKKLLLGLGTIATTIAPIVAVVSCGSKDSTATSTSFEKVNATDKGTVLQLSPGISAYISEDDASKAGSLKFEQDDKNSITVTWDKAISASDVKYNIETVVNGTKKAASTTAPTTVELSTIKYLLNLSGMTNMKLAITDKTMLSGIIAANMAGKKDVKNKLGFVTKADAATPTSASKETIDSVNELIKSIGLEVVGTVSLTTKDDVITVAPGFSLVETANKDKVDAAKTAFEKMTGLLAIGQTIAANTTATTFADEAALKAIAALGGHVTFDGFPSEIDGLTMSVTKVEGVADAKDAEGKLTIHIVAGDYSQDAQVVIKSAHV